MNKVSKKFLENLAANPRFGLMPTARKQEILTAIDKEKSGQQTGTALQQEGMKIGKDTVNKDWYNGLSDVEKTELKSSGVKKFVADHYVTVGDDNVRKEWFDLLPGNEQENLKSLGISKWQSQVENKYLAGLPDISKVGITTENILQEEEPGGISWRERAILGLPEPQKTYYMYQYVQLGTGERVTPSLWSSLTNEGKAVLYKYGISGAQQLNQVRSDVVKALLTPMYDEGGILLHSQGSTVGRGGTAVMRYPWEVLSQGKSFAEQQDYYLQYMPGGEEVRVYLPPDSPGLVAMRKAKADELAKSEAMMAAYLAQVAALIRKANPEISASELNQLLEKERSTLISVARNYTVDSSPTINTDADAIVSKMPVFATLANIMGTDRLFVKTQASAKPSVMELPHPTAPVDVSVVELPHPIAPMEMNVAEPTSVEQGAGINLGVKRGRRGKRLFGVSMVQDVPEEERKMRVRKMKKVMPAFRRNGDDGVIASALKY